MLTNSLKNASRYIRRLLSTASNFLENALQFMFPDDDRINRSRYATIVVLSGVLVMLYAMVARPRRRRNLYVLLIVHAIISSIQRAHDINLSGAWIALYLLGAIAIGVLPEISDSYNDLRTIPFLSIYCIIIPSLLLIIPGTKGVNKFGEQPPESSLLVRFIAAIALLFYILSLFLIAIGLYYNYTP